MASLTVEENGFAALMRPVAATQNRAEDMALRKTMIVQSADKKEGESLHRQFACPA
jgi:hypothetical protein